MSVIVTKAEIPKTCGSCEASGTGVCRKWTYKDCGQKRADDCPLKSIDGLIEKIEQRKSSFLETGNWLEAGECMNLIHIIKEYCEVSDADND